MQKPRVHPDSRTLTYSRGHFYFFKAERIPFVEHEKHQRLEEGHLELLLSLKENGHGVWGVVRTVYGKAEKVPLISLKLCGVWG